MPRLVLPIAFSPAVVVPLVSGLVIMAGASAALAADCAPLGSVPNYVASPDQKTRAYDSFGFDVAKGDGNTETVNVAGRLCEQSYTPKNGVDPMSDLEIQSNYRDQLKKLGAQVLFSDDRDTVARIVKGAQETWVKVYSQETEIDVTVVDKTPFKASLLPPSGNDYRLLGHLPNYVADKPEKRNFDKSGFTVKDGDDSREIEIRGARYTVAYTPKQGAAPLSDLDIQENYRVALAALGAQILFTDGRDTVARLDDKGRSVWIKVYSQETEIDVTAIEEKPFEVSVRPPDSGALKAALDKNGHVALYVHFDFNKATLKPDAAPVIAEVVKLMKANPALRLEIDGYTDNVGARDYNVKLSGSRAAAVAAAVIGQGVDAGRLATAGLGPDKPVASNDTDEGRAKNRRVELVKP